MKKIINSALAVTFVTLLFSCQKQDELTPPASRAAVIQTGPNSLEPLPPIRVPFTLSEWFSVPLSQVKDGSLYGRYTLRNPISSTTDTDIKIAYVRRNNPGSGSPTDGFNYTRLPAVVNTSEGHPVSMKFVLASDFFEIFLLPAGIVPVILDPAEFKDCAYRYIVISKSDYEQLNIEWDNYLAVADALGFAP